MRVSEIYACFEGRGLLIGLPQIVVRVMPNNEELTEGSSDKVPKELTSDELLASFDSNSIKAESVSIIGDKAVYQKDIVSVVKTLIKKNYYLKIEVSSEDYNQDVFRNVDYISVNIIGKKGYSKDSIKNINKILYKYDFKTEIRFFVENEKDIDAAIDTYRKDFFDKKNFINYIVIPYLDKKSKSDKKEFLKTLHSKILNEQLQIRVILSQPNYLRTSGLR